MKIIIKLLSIIIITLGIIFLIKYLKLDKIRDNKLSKAKLIKKQNKNFTIGLSLIVLGLLILFI